MLLLLWPLFAVLVCPSVDQYLDKNKHGENRISIQTAAALVDIPMHIQPPAFTWLAVFSQKLPLILLPAHLEAWLKSPVRQHS